MREFVDIDMIFNHSLSFVHDSDTLFFFTKDDISIFPRIKYVFYRTLVAMETYHRENENTYNHRKKRVGNMRI